MENYNFYMSNHNAFSVTPILDNVVRIRYNASGIFKKSIMERYDIINSEISKPKSDFSNGETKIIKSGNLEIRINNDTTISVFSKGTKIIYSLLPFHPQDEIGCGGKIRIAENERFYGCGYRPMKGIELRGEIIKNWCAPVTNNGPSTYFMSSNGWGLFWNNSCETFFDFGNRNDNELVFWSLEGEFDVFLFIGSFKEMISDFTTITGKPSLMPLNGYGITVVNGEVENEISLIDKAERLRREKIPCDNFSISCEWMETYYDKTVNQKFDKGRYFIQSWMRPENVFLHALKRFGIKCTLWTPCAYDLTYEQERIYTKKHPEEIKQPLYTRPLGKKSNSKDDAASFDDSNLFPTMRFDPYTIPDEPWYEHFKKFWKFGIIGLAEDGHAVQITKIDHLYGNGYSYKYMHNLNQTLNSIQYFESYKEFTGKRIFVRTPSTFIGHQKYCGTWCGDTSSDTSLIGLMQYSFQGQSNVTADMVSKDVMQIHAGMFMPWVLNFCWGSYVWPWMLEDWLRDIYVDYARLRYALMPYIYTAAYNTHISGIPMCTAMIINYPNDERFYNCFNQYMFGESILVSALTNEIHLPEGKWIDYWTGKEYNGNITIKDGFTDDKGGYFFIKKGAIIPMWENVQYVGEKEINAMTVKVYPNIKESYTMYEDDGITFEYENGAYAKTVFSYICENGKITFTIDKDDNNYKLPENRIYHIEVFTEKPPALCEGTVYDETKKAICFNMKAGQSFTIG